MDYTYVINYRLRFLNRQQDIYRVEILKKIYPGDAIPILIELEGGEKPFVLKNKNDTGDTYSPIISTEADIEFWNTDTNGTYAVNLSNFYSNDESMYRVDFYNEQVNGLPAQDNLLWSGFLLMDSAQEDITDVPHIITLNATDNIAALKKVPLSNLNGSALLGQQTLQTLLGIILQSTNLQLPLNAYINLFEANLNANRSVTPTNDFIQQTVIDTRYFQNSDFTFQDCYTILEQIMTAFYATIVQSNGSWNIIRIPEYRYFGGSIPGTNYDYTLANLTTTTFNKNLSIGRGIDIIPINANQTNRILRPFAFSKRTFSYDQSELINNANFVYQPPFIPVPNPAPVNYLPTPFYSTDGETTFVTSGVTQGSLTQDPFYNTKVKIEDFHITPTQSENNPGFREWQLMNGNTGVFMELALDHTNHDNELERYIYQPYLYNNSQLPSGLGATSIRLNPVPIKKGDTFDFSINWRQPNNNVNFNFSIIFSLIASTGDIYYLFFTADTNHNLIFEWITAAQVAGGSYNILTSFALSNSNNTPQQWANGSIKSLLQLNANVLNHMEGAPIDGLLLIDIVGQCGIKTSSGHIDAVPIYWKQPQLTVYSALNSGQLKINGQYNLQQQNIVIKNYNDINIQLDDSITKTTKGALFTNALTNFGGALGSRYNTLTATWQRQGIDTVKKFFLSQITTFEDLFLHRIPRTIIDGDFFGIRHVNGSAVEFVDFLTTYQFTFLLGKHFIMSNAEIDYMAAEITSGTFYEIFLDGETDASLGTPDSQTADGVTNLNAYTYSLISSNNG